MVDVPLGLSDQGRYHLDYVLFAEDIRLDLEKLGFGKQVLVVEVDHELQKGLSFSEAVEADQLIDIALEQDRVLPKLVDIVLEDAVQDIQELEGLLLLVLVYKVLRALETENFILLAVRVHQNLVEHLCEHLELLVTDLSVVQPDLVLQIEALEKDLIQVHDVVVLRLEVRVVLAELLDLFTQKSLCLTEVPVQFVEVFAH